MRNRKADIEKYLRGELSPAEMHALEKAALNDPFLAEALEGVEQAGADNFLYDLHRINRSLRDRSRRRSTKNNNTIRMWGWTSAIAATVLLVAVSGFLVINILRDQAAQEQIRKELAVLQADEEIKDTVFIPLPREMSTVSTSEKMTVPQKDEPPSVRGGIAVNESEAPVAPANDASKIGAHEATDATETGDASKEELLAQNEALRQRESTAKEEIARAAENPAREEVQSKSAVADDDKARRAAKRFDGRAAGAESRAQEEPTVSAAITRDAALLRGQVVSASDGQALPGVNVMIDGTRDGTVTDIQGNFQLTIPEDKTRVVFSFIGYLAEEVEVKGQEEIKVQLREDMTTLSEVVVTGYASDGASSEERGTFSFAEPEGGRADFKKYLNNAIRYPAEALSNKTEGRVTVRFTVETNGALTDFEVLKGIGRGCDEELIRAIKDGPSWKPSTQGERALREQVKVRFKFQLPD